MHNMCIVVHLFLQYLYFNFKAVPKLAQKRMPNWWHIINYVIMFWIAEEINSDKYAANVSWQYNSSMFRNTKTIYYQRKTSCITLKLRAGFG